MNKLAFVLTTIAGLSTLIGGIIIVCFKKNNRSFIAFTLSFASGVMVGVSYLDLIPESLKSFSKLNHIRCIIILIVIFIGFLLAWLVKFTINKFSKDNNLYQLGLISLIVIVLHNIPEGIVTYLSSSINLKIGISMTVAIALHNIPEGITIALPIYSETKKVSKALFYAAVAGLSEPIGALFIYFFMIKTMNKVFMGGIYALIAGMMIEIALFELWPESFVNNKKYSYLGIIFGFAVMLLSQFLLG